MTLKGLYIPGSRPHFSAGNAAEVGRWIDQGQRPADVVFAHPEQDEERQRKDPPPAGCYPAFALRAQPAKSNGSARAKAQPCPDGSATGQEDRA